METKSIVKTVVAIIILGVFAVGGYLLGSKSSSVTTTSTVGSTAGSSSFSAQPVNSTAIINELKAKFRENPDDVNLAIRLGDAYFELKQFNEAVTYYKKSIELKADSADVYNDLGLSLHYLGNSTEGLRYLDEGIKKNPYHQRVWLTKGFLLAYGMGDIDAAKTAWEKAAALDPESQIGKAASDYLAQINKQ